MRKLIMLGAVVVAVAFPGASRAQLSLGLRVGYAPAMGDAVKDGAMDNVVKSQIPIQLDAMYRITPQWSAGAYFSYGFGQLDSTLSDACDAVNVNCSLRSMRFGAQVTYAFTKAFPSFVPWAGLGTGYETGTLKVGDVKSESSGFEWLNVQLGGDYKVNPKFAVGPYFMLSVGQYSTVDGSSVGADTGTHEWLNFGVRGKFDL